LQAIFIVIIYREYYFRLYLNSPMKNTTDSTQTQLAAACILLSVADADEILEEQELITISYFNLVLN